MYCLLEEPRFLTAIVSTMMVSILGYLEVTYTHLCSPRPLDVEVFLHRVTDPL